MQDLRRTRGRPSQRTAAVAGTIDERAISAPSPHRASRTTFFQRRRMISAPSHSTMLRSGVDLHRRRAPQATKSNGTRALSSRTIDFSGQNQAGRGRDKPQGNARSDGDSIEGILVSWTVGVVVMPHSNPQPVVDHPRSPWRHRGGLGAMQ